LECLRSAGHLRSAEDVISFQCLRSAKHLRRAGDPTSDDDLAMSGESSIVAVEFAAPKLRNLGKQTIKMSRYQMNIASAPQEFAAVPILPEDSKSNLPDIF
jgi:hypothetical protein